MANFAPSSSSPSPSLLGFAEASMAISYPRGDDDLEQDCCSICLELFNSDDPSAITHCKHEYHLHCILEWSQRSEECPICWQSLSLIDPTNQELLSAVEKERRSRSRNINSPITAPTVHYFQPNDDSDIDSAEEFVFDERIMQNLATTASGAHPRGRERHRFLGSVRPEAFIYGSPANDVNEQSHEIPPNECGGLSPKLSLNAEASTPVVVPCDYVDSQVAFKPRVLYSQSPSVRQQRPSPSDTPTFSDSIKSKWSAASARYKDSISKSTKGLKEKLLARNNSVKELSKEMSAGVARMIERFDLSSKKSSDIVPSPKGKAVLESFLVRSLSKNTGGKIPRVTSNGGEKA